MGEKHRKNMFVYGLGHVELVEIFFALTDFPLMGEGRRSLYGRWTSLDLGDSGETCEEAIPLICSGHGGFWFLY